VHVEIAFGELFDQRIDGGKIARLIVCAIEQQRRDRRSGPRKGMRIAPGARDRNGRPIARAAFREIVERFENAREIGGTAMHKRQMQTAIEIGVDVGKLLQLCVVVCVARQQGKLRAAALHGFDEPVDAVGPIAASAQEPHDDDSRMCGRALDIEIDRIGMFEGRHIGKPQRLAFARARKPCEVAVRHRQHDDLARGLGKIDRSVGVEDCPRRGGQQMHQARAARMALASMPLRPITTTREPRGSSLRQGRSK